MNKSERDRIKEKILLENPNKWWGDDFDSRFYLISKIKSIKNKFILDHGGGVGIISSEINKNNSIVNLDLSFNDLKISNETIKDKIHTICSDVKKLPFKDNSFDFIISSSMLQYIRNNDIKNNQTKKKNSINIFPSVEITLKEIKRILKPNGKIFIITPNNAYYKSYMFNFEELNETIKNNFSTYKIFFYNTYPRLSRKYRKLNFANTIPKLNSKFLSPDKVINSLSKTSSKNNYSVSFFIECINDSDDI
jgi:ubiquinone/menaquinone biosynthesis C-methylase UbiE